MKRDFMGRVKERSERTRRREIQKKIAIGITVVARERNDLAFKNPSYLETVKQERIRDR
jgi:hypothetical protein